MNPAHAAVHPATPESAAPPMDATVEPWHDEELEKEGKHRQWMPRSSRGMTEERLETRFVLGPFRFIQPLSTSSSPGSTG